MIADSLEVEDTREGVRSLPRRIDKLDRINYLDVILSFWGTTENDNFNLMEELGKFKGTLDKNDNVLTVAEKIKTYFENVSVLDYEDELGFHICGYKDSKAHIHHVHHIRTFRNNLFKNEDSQREFCGVYRRLDYPILFNGDNLIPNLIINLIQPFNDQIRYRDFNNEKSRSFLTYLMDTAIKLQGYSSRSLTRGILIDYPLRFAEITRDEIKLEIIR